MSNLNRQALRITLVVAGLFALFSGLDQALGGYHTLGWMGQPSFFEVTDPEAFRVADNHQRFLGGVWTAMGLMILWGSANPQKHAGTLNFIFGAVVLGGLARFSQMDAGVVFGPVLAALLVELVGMPVLFVWLSRSMAKSPA